MSLKASDHFLHHGDDVLAVAVADALMRFGCWYAAGGRYLAKMIAISGSIERWVNVRVTDRYEGLCARPNRFESRATLSQSGASEPRGRPMSKAASRSTRCCR